MFKKIIPFILIAQSAFALGFWGMGNTSAGLGGSGVALRKSAWGIYYNPALLASDNRGKFGYSVGINIEEQGLDEIVTALFESQNPDPNLIYNRFQANPKHTLGINSQNGIVIQITGGGKEVPKLDTEGKPTGEMIEKRNPYGAFTLAAFVSLHSFGEIDAKLSNGSSNQTLEASANLSTLALIEAPVGWGWRFETQGGDVSIGLALKYMGVTGFSSKLNMMINETEATLNFDTPQNLSLSHSFGIDLGLLYTPIDGVNLGIVAKNINMPSFKIGNQTFKIDPQVRFGMSYEFAKYFALTFDVDLTTNQILFKDSPKTQMLGGGFLMDFKYIDFRFGLMGDMANKFHQGVIMTGGLNLLGFLDVAIQASSEMFSVNNFKVPKYLTLKVGGSFTF